MPAHDGEPGRASAPAIEPSFLALPLRRLAEAALDRAKALGASHADFRCERIRSQLIRLRDAELDGMNDDSDTGMCVRVVHQGTWGFAAGQIRTPREAARLAEQAVRVAEVCAAVNSVPVRLAAEPAHGDRTWISSYEIDPFEVPDARKTALLTDWSARLLAAPGIDHVDAAFEAVRENKFYADTGGTTATQQRVRVHAVVEAYSVDKTTGAFESMRTIAPPVGRGWEYLTGAGGWDWDAELAQIPDLLAARVAAPSVAPGEYDLVIDPSNLWLTIHESIGHATELDRALGYEAAYAGTSFATPDRLGTLRYGSSAMNVTGDRTAEHGLSTVGFDDEGVEAQSWDLIKDGILVGYQLDRSIAGQVAAGNVAVGAGGVEVAPRSNGCAFADSPGHTPVQRMANVSLRADPDGPSTEELISRVSRGLYIVGDKSWSIDMQRYNFQFTGQRAYLIEDGRLSGQVKDFAYQATTTDFWGALDAVGGPQTYVLGGAFNCGKAQPGQVAPVSHGCPTALFRGVRILNTVQEAGR